MGRIFLTTTAVCIGGFLLAACSSSNEPPPPFASGAPASAPEQPGGGSAPATPDKPGTTTPDGEPEWTPPVVPTSSAACGGAVAGMNGADFTTPSGRTFHVWGPPSYDPNKTYPVVIMYHGWYANGRGFQGWFEMEKYVEGEAFVVYPDANGPTWDLNGQSDLVFFDEMVKQLGETYCINPSRVLAFGFSYGAKFANTLGCKRAGYVKAISAGDGSLGGPMEGCGRLPVLVTHRTADQDELIAWGRTASETWASVAGCDATAAMVDPEMNCVSHANCKNPASVTFCEDTWYDPSWDPTWNHTVRETYRAYTWKWFSALP